MPETMTSAAAYCGIVNMLCRAGQGGDLAPEVTAGWLLQLILFTPYDILLPAAAFPGLATLSNLELTSPQGLDPQLQSRWRCLDVLFEGVARRRMEAGASPLPLSCPVPFETLAQAAGRSPTAGGVQTRILEDVATFAVQLRLPDLLEVWLRVVAPIVTVEELSRCTRLSLPLDGTRPLVASLACTRVLVAAWAVAFPYNAGTPHDILPVVNVEGSTVEQLQDVLSLRPAHVPLASKDVVRRLKLITRTTQAPLALAILRDFGRNMVAPGGTGAATKAMVAMWGPTDGPEPTKAHKALVGILPVLESAFTRQELMSTCCVQYMQHVARIQAAVKDKPKAGAGADADADADALAATRGSVQTPLAALAGTGIATSAGAALRAALTNPDRIVRVVIKDPVSKPVPVSTAAPAPAPAPVVQTGPGACVERAAGPPPIRVPLFDATDDVVLPPSAKRARGRPSAK